VLVPQLINRYLACGLPPLLGKRSARAARSLGARLTLRLPINRYPF